MTEQTCRATVVNLPAKTLWGRMAEDVQAQFDHLKQVATAFFSPNVDQHSDDPLVEVVRRNPSAACRFIRTVMIFSGLGSVVVCSIGALYLTFFWQHCGGCDRPLRWWLLVHTGLQVMQIPVRFVFLARLHDVADADVNTNLEACVSSFTASPAWRASKNVSLFTYGWFVLGVVWVVNAGGCHECPGIYRLTVGVIIQAIARAVVALVCFKVLFPTSDLVARDDAPKVEGATPDEISALPLVRFTVSLFPGEQGASCAVCLSDYELGEQLRRLPCGHHFHRKCADKWLRRSKRCPLCVRVIDAAEEHKECNHVL